MVGGYSGFGGVQGECFGPYELRGELGRGAMARVWRAWDPNLGREVAIKEPLFDEVVNPDIRAEMAHRFVREAKTAARLQHPNIVAIFAADVYDGRPAIVMELVEGATLGEILECGSLAPDAVLDVLDQLLDAVGYAHNQGVVHRDIKPDNIFVSNDGRVKLADFGIAYADGDDARKTMFGAVLGTPGYMSPGQAQGERADARNDLFSIGVVGYEMLAGRNPFGVEDGADTTTLIYRTIYEPVSELPGFAVRGLPAGVGPAILAALAKSPYARPQTAAEFKSMLHDDSPSRVVGMEWSRGGRESGRGREGTGSDRAGERYEGYERYGEDTGGEDAGMASGDDSGRSSHMAYIIVAALGAAILIAMALGASSGGGDGGSAGSRAVASSSSVSTATSFASGAAASTSNSSASSASSSTVLSASSAKSFATGSKFVGKWDIVEIEVDGEVQVSREDANLVREAGEDISFVFRANGTMSLIGGHHVRWHVDRIHGNDRRNIACQRS